MTRPTATDRSEAGRPASLPEAPGPEGLEPIFRPRSVAVIGASPRRDSIGGRILRNLTDYGFEGKVFPVNPRYDVIQSMKCYRSVAEVPDDLDLAVIVVAREAVLSVAEECGRKGVRGLVVITAGFREVGAEGRALEDRLVEIVRRHRMRMIGPNCYGVINTHPSVRLDATFGKHHPAPGRIGFMTQSGALGQVIIEYAMRYGVGFAMMASVGNKANISGNDLLEFWRDDDEVDIILLYLESFGNPRKFSQITRGLARRKPIIAVKSGRTAAGARATVSHTGALAGLDIAVDALFEQCGILRVGTVEELFNLTMAFANQPLPRGDRVAIVTNAGGPAVMATDAVSRAGLAVAELAEGTRERMRAVLPPAASVANPVDMIASAGPEQYRVCMQALLDDPNVDALLVIYVPPLMIDTEAVLDVIGQAGAGSDKTILGCIMGAEEGSYLSRRVEGKRFIPAYAFPESAVESLAAMARYRRWRTREDGTRPLFEADRETVRRILAEVRSRGERNLVAGEALRVLAAYGVPVVAHREAAGMEAVLAAAGEIGFPLALKLAARDVLHKTEVGGVSLDLRDEAQLRRAYESLERRMREGGRSAGEPVPVLLQPMVQGGVETVLGMSTDPAFGPLLMFGLGGIFVELLQDVTFRILPISDRDAAEMVSGLRGYRMLAGFRGQPPADRAAIEEALLRLSQLAADFPEIAEFDVNPFLAAPAGRPSRAVDARIVLAP